MKAIRLFTSLAVVCMFLLFPSQGMAQCGPLNVTVSMTQSPIVFMGTDLIILQATANVTLSPAASVPPVDVELGFSFYDTGGSGVFFHTETGTTSWDPLSNSATYTVATFIFPQCGNFAVIVSAKGLNSNGSTCTNTNAIGYGRVCVSQYVKKGITVSCNTDICGGSATRLAENGPLSLEAIHQTSSDKLVIKIKAPSAASSSLELFNISGQTLLQQPLDLEKGLQTHKLPIGGISPGMYILRLNTVLEQTSQKVLIR